jgi:hypothetical protein
MSDYVSGLRQDLVEAAARQQQRSPAARAARPLHPRAWSPVAVLGAAAVAAAVVIAVVGIRAIAPKPEPSNPKVVQTIHLGGQPRDAAAVGGRFLIANLDGTLTRLLPAEPGRRRQLLAVGGTPASLAVDGESVWVVIVGSGTNPRSRLLQLDARDGRRLARVPVDGYASYVAVGAGGVWLADLHSGGLMRIDPRTHKRSAFIPNVAAEGLAVTDRSVWGRAGATVTQMDAGGRVLSRVGGISLAPGDESQRTLLADADGAWVVGQLDGLLYRVERGLVVKRLALGDTAGVIARSGSTVWVSASRELDRYELVRVDADEGKVTGRVSVGRHLPQAIVPIGKDVWVVTSEGDLLRVR